MKLLILAIQTYGLNSYYVISGTSNIRDESNTYLKKILARESLGPLYRLTFYVIVRKPELYPQ